jgi:hypothetical protein
MSRSGIPLKGGINKPSPDVASNIKNEINRSIPVKT